MITLKDFNDKGIFEKEIELKHGRSIEIVGDLTKSEVLVKLVHGWDVLDEKLFHSLHGMMGYESVTDVLNRINPSTDNYLKLTF